MINIYTPERWRSLFNFAPSLIIEKDGLIYNEEEYVKLFRNPIGKIDFESGYIYGEDYLKLMRTPIGCIRKNGNIVKIYGEDYADLFANPILYIKDNKIYSPDEYFKLFPSEMAYIKKEPIREVQGSCGNIQNSSTRMPEPLKRDSDEKLHIPKIQIEDFIFILAGIFFILLIIVATYFTFFTEEYMQIAFIAIICGAVAALLMAESMGESIGYAEGVSVFVFWIYESYESFQAGNLTSFDIVAIIVSPFLMLLVFAIPAVIVGVLVWGIKRLFKRSK